MNLSIEEKFVSYCINKKIYVNLAESCTGGLISSKITSVSNASQIFKYSFITYNNESKHEFLKVPVNLEPGDMLIYKGCDLFHWREKFEGEHHLQAFLHYNDKNGPYGDNLYDGRENLGLPNSKTKE